ncbi:MAG: DUF523 domain-containing protein [Clostridiales bacterium]|nr:DUF523 domain-containing protein [Clostridiales bacterium]MDD6979539.1 DUF523 domain-containing protein [Bacillota bacterium]MDD7130909.1 DUF523 domain-containing protein [Bacillota bacterium]MDY5607390.1 DUF523 domain-containing protein [Lentihominibacter sp.]MDY6174086.1 DUF523 domain-containing protein [Lentihominibacter sp.]
MKIMVSACLLGDNVKYNGGNNRHEKVLEYIKGHEVVPVCPEMLGGLPVPRAPGEIQDGIVRNEDGTSVDYEYRTGAAQALEIAESERIDMAILQSRSPSCGVNQIYDGSFTGRKIKGMGVFARLLSEKGYKVVDAEDI